MPAQLETQVKSPTQNLFGASARLRGNCMKGGTVAAVIRTMFAEKPTVASVKVVEFRAVLTVQGEVAIEV
jgi:hypothetical protein